MVALIRGLITRNADLAIHTSAPTTVVTMPPGTTTTTALPTIGNAAATTAVFYARAARLAQNEDADAPAVKRETGANDLHSFGSKIGRPKERAAQGSEV